MINITKNHTELMMDILELIGVMNLNKEEQELYYHIKEQHDKVINMCNPCEQTKEELKDWFKFKNKLNEYDNRK